MVINAVSDSHQNLYNSNWNQMMNDQSSQGQGKSLRHYEYQQRMQSRQNQSIVEQSLGYASKLSQSRAKTDEELLQKKKLQYSFKKISSQIVRSKNSTSARKAVLSARREVLRLKRLKGNDDYDEEEIQLAIDHAKAMERVAKKKVHHLEQEEMIERHGKGISSCLEELEDESENEDQGLSEEEMTQEELEEAEYASLDLEEDMSMEMLFEDMEEFQSDITQTLSLDDMTELSEEMINDIADAMAEMLEEMDLTDLAETMYAPDPDMSEDDLKMLKIKHRTKEMKDIAKADKEYLKGLIEHEKSKPSASGSPSGSGSAAGIISFGRAPAVAPVITIPGTVSSAPVLSGGFDISV